MPTPKTFITRKEIATLAECSVESVRHNETGWGLKPLRTGHARPYRYFRVKTLECLKSLKLIG